MSNNVAQATAKVVFSQKHGSYYAYINCDKGDVFQFYSPSGAGFSYTPDYSLASNHALFEVVITNSQFSVDIDSVSWELNGVSVSSYPMLFQSVTGHSEQLRMIGNPGQYTGNASATLTCVIEVHTPNMQAGQTDTITLHYNIRVTEGSADARIVTIQSYHTGIYTNNFVITSKDPLEAGYKCYLQAVGYQGTEDKTSDWYYKWYKSNPSAQGLWTEIPSGDSAVQGANNQILEVKEPDVNAWGMYKVVAYGNSACSGAQMGFDVQEISDFSDDLYIDVQYSPADALIEEGNNSRQAVMITPLLKTRDTNRQTDALQNASFYFTATDGAGNVLPRLHSAVDASGATHAYDKDSASVDSQTLCKAVWVGIDCAQQAGGDVSVFIESQPIASI